MRFKRPSAGTILGGLALFVALGGTAAAATGSLVNIADPSHSSYLAHVDKAGRLQVGDSAGALNVEETPVSSYFHASSLQPGNGTGSCVVIASVPTTKPIVVRQVRVSVVDSFGSFGPNNSITIYADKTCSNQIATVYPGSYGQTVIPFDPGYAIPAGSGLSAETHGNVDDFYIDGYTYS